MTLSLASSSPARPVVISYGGGLNSWTMLVEAVNRGLHVDYVTFCNVGDHAGKDPGEWPSTYRHIQEVVKPLCEDLGIKFVELHSDVRGERSLYAWMTKRGQIPVAGPNRICTIIAKVEPFERWMNETFPGQEVEVWIGFEAGEESRAANDPNAGGRKKGKPGDAIRCNRFPLIEWQICRCRCEAIARDSGYPVPRKSACVFCPYGSKGDWQTFAKEMPEAFGKVAKMEADKPPTAKAGKKLSIMGYSAVKTSPAQHKALAALKAGEPVKRKATMAVLLRYELVKDGALTAKGEEALAHGPKYEIGYKAPPLPEYIQGAYKAAKKACPVCGQAERATKATGCTYLSDQEANGGAGLVQLTPKKAA